MEQQRCGHPCSDLLQPDRASHSPIPSLLPYYSCKTHSSYTNEPRKSHTKKAEETTEMSCLWSLSELEVSGSGTATVSNISKCCECSQIHTCLCAQTGMSMTEDLHTDMKTKALFSTHFSGGGCSACLVSQIPNICPYCQKSFTFVPALQRDLWVSQMAPKLWVEWALSAKTLPCQLHLISQTSDCSSLSPSLVLFTTSRIKHHYRGCDCQIWSHPFLVSPAIEKGFLLSSWFRRVHLIVTKKTRWSLLWWEYDSDSSPLLVLESKKLG